MYKIEKFLIENGLKLKRSYESGVLVYQDYCSDPEDEGFYGVDEVVLFPNHKPMEYVSNNLLSPVYAFIRQLKIS